MGDVGQLVTDGMAPEQAATFAKRPGKTATATKAGMTDLAQITYALSDALRITDAKELEQAFGMAVTAFVAREIYGKDAITQIVASLEVGKSSSSAKEEVTNMSNWLAPIG